MEILIVTFVMDVIAMIVIVILGLVVRLYVAYLVHVGIADLFILFLFFFVKISFKGLILNYFFFK